MFHLPPMKMKMIWFLIWVDLWFLWVDLWFLWVDLWFLVHMMFLEVDMTIVVVEVWKVLTWNSHFQLAFLHIQGKIVHQKEVQSHNSNILT